MEGIAWDSQSLDGTMVKAPLALEVVGKNPTDREKNGCKRSILTDKKDSRKAGWGKMVLASVRRSGNPNKLLNDAGIVLKRRPFATRFTFQ